MVTLLSYKIGFRRILLVYDISSSPLLASRSWFESGRRGLAMLPIFQRTPNTNEPRPKSFSCGLTDYQVSILESRPSYSLQNSKRLSRPFGRTDYQVSICKSRASCSLQNSKRFSQPVPPLRGPANLPRVGLIDNWRQRVHKPFSTGASRIR